MLPGPPGLRFLTSRGPRINRFVHRVAKTASYSWWRPVRALRRELGLEEGASPLFAGKYSPHLNLALFSRELQPPQPDWPAHTIQTGFLFHDEARAAVLPHSVADFLRAGEPPLVFTLGSAAVQLPGSYYEESAAAALALGRRALLLLGRNPRPVGLPPSIFAWDYLPYAAIFPHAAAVVHQGGVGTTAQTMRAGRPMLVMPFAHDQFDNAARVTRLGIGREIARRSYRRDRVANELRILLNDPRYHETATEIGRRIRDEKPEELACAALERVIGGFNAALPVK